MSLKINYLDQQRGSTKNTTLFLAKESKISDFRGIFNNEINQKILNFLKNNKKTQKSKIASLNLEFDQKLVVILIVNKHDAQQSEKLGAKFYDHVKGNNIEDVLILGSNFSSIVFCNRSFIRLKSSLGIVRQLFDGYPPPVPFKTRFL